MVRAKQTYCFAIPALAATTFHFPISPLTIAVISSGELPLASPPICWSFLCTSGTFSAFLTDLFKIAITEAGVPAGAMKPAHDRTS